MLKDLPEAAYLYYSMQSYTKDWFLKKELSFIEPWEFVGYVKYEADESFPELADDDHKYLGVFNNPARMTGCHWLELMNHNHTYKANFEHNEAVILFGKNLDVSLEENFTLKIIRE